MTIWLVRARKSLILTVVVIILISFPILAGEIDSHQIREAGDELNLFETLNPGITQTLDDSDLAALADGRFNASTVVDYTQTFNLPHASVQWAVDPNSTPGDPQLFLRFPAGSTTIDYQLAFTVQARSRYNGSRLIDFENKTISLLGTEYTVISAINQSGDGGAIHLTLESNSAIVEFDGANNTLTINGNNIEDVLIFISGSKTMLDYGLSTIDIEWTLPNDKYVKELDYLSSAINNTEDYVLFLNTTRLDFFFEGLEFSNEEDLKFSASGKNFYKIDFTNKNNVNYNQKFAFYNATSPWHISWGEDAADPLRFVEGERICRHDYFITEYDKISRMLRLVDINEINFTVSIKDVSNAEILHFNYSLVDGSHIAFMPMDGTIYTLNVTNPSGDCALLLDTAQGDINDIHADIWTQYDVKVTFADQRSGTFWPILVTENSAGKEDGSADIDRYSFAFTWTSNDGIDLSLVNFTEMETSNGSVMIGLGSEDNVREGMTQWGNFIRQSNMDNQDRWEITISEYEAEAKVFVEAQKDLFSCSNPSDGQIITENTTFCARTYNLPNGVIVNADNIKLDCHGARLVGNNTEQNGILLNQVNNTQIINCELLNYGTGIHVYRSHYNALTSNIIAFANSQGIGLSFATSNLLHDNTVSQNDRGIALRISDHNTFNWNFIHGNNFGIFLEEDSQNNTFQKNIVIKNDRGIILDDEVNNVIQFNSFYDNTVHNLWNNQAINISIPLNYWGTVNISEIENNILDFYDDDSLGIADFCPFLDAPYPNGVSQSCEEICTSNWIKEDNLCLINDKQLISYTDANNCLDVDPPSDNGTFISCNYCTPTWEAQNGACQNGERPVHYEYTNTCCQETGLLSDCSIPDDTVVVCTDFKMIISDLEVKVDGKKDRGINDGDTISKDAEPGSKVQFDVEIENLFAQLELEDIEITVTIDDIDDGDELEEEASDFDLKPGKKKSKKVSFDIPYAVDEDDYDVTIQVLARDENRTKHEITWNVKLELDKQKHDIRIMRAELSRSTITCEQNSRLSLDILNLGSEDEDEVTISVNNDQLGLNILENLELDEGTDDDSGFSNRYSISGNNKTTGTYPISIVVRADNKLMDEETLDLEVNECANKKVPEEKEQISCGNSCLAGNKCYPEGTSGRIQSQLVYCNGENWIQKKELNELCESSYQCLNNNCQNELCQTTVPTPILPPPDPKYNLFSFFSRLFDTW